MHGIVTTIVILGIIAAFIGLFFKLPIFGNRRLVALGLLVLLGTGGIKFADGLRKPEQVRADEKLDATMAATQDHRASTDYDAVHRSPEKFISVDLTLENNGGIVAIKGTLSNGSQYAISNVDLRCDQLGETNKRLDRERITVTKLVPANGSVAFGPLNLAIADQQTVSVVCNAVDGDAAEYTG